MQFEMKRIEKHLGFSLEEKTKQNLIENKIDYETFVGMSKEDLKNFFNIEIKDDIEIEKINGYLRTIKLTLSDECKVELTKNQISAEQFLKLNKSELTALKFKFGDVLKITKNQESATDNNKIVKMKKFLTTAKTIDNNEQKQQLEEAFSNIILEKVNRKFLIESLSSADKGRSSFIAELKPYLFDMLKRNQKFEKIINEFHSILHCAKEFDEKTRDLIKRNEDMINTITERDLMVGLIESVNKTSLPRLGYLISKNDLPLPLTYYVIDEQLHGSLAYRCNFDLFYDTLCLTDRSMALVTGTESTKNKGKSMLIPLIFPGLNKNSIYNMDANTLRKEGIDIICNEETSEKWVVADFNGSLTSNELNMNIYRSMSAFACLHIVNVNIRDFDLESGEPVAELKSQFEWHHSLKTNITVVVIFRDMFNDEQIDLHAINEYLKTNYSDVNFECIKIENTFENASTHKLTSIKTQFIVEIGSIMNKLKRKPMHSILDIKSTFEKLINKDINNNIQAIRTDIEYGKVELDFRRLFDFKHDNKIDKLRSIFALSDILKKIEQKKKVRAKAYYSLGQDYKKQLDTALDTIKKELDELEDRKSQIKPKNEYLQFFIDLILNSDENCYINLLIFEKCLLNLKREELDKLRKQRQTVSNDYKELEAELKQRYDEKKSKRKNKLHQELCNIDEQIEILDLTLDKFWDEIFLYFDWLDENKQHDEQKDKIIDKYVDLLNKGFSIHLLRGNPLKIHSNAMASVFDKIKKQKNIYVISVIGEQSSAKSSLLNALFGCDFRTSSGRCTVGIYLNFVHYMDKTIVILDTEGLASIDNSNSTFDNQMATMAVFSSHMIIINHKGEISSNLEDILGISFFAKLNLLNKSFKPLIVFILRDQTSKDPKNLAGQAAKLTERLIEKAKFTMGSVENVMKIETDKLYLMSNAFSYDQDKSLSKEVKWRNDVFPEEVLELRKSLMDKFTSIDLTGGNMSSFAELYSKMSSYWKTIQDAGENIFNCKDLEEIKVRNEISFKANNLIEKNCHKFTDELRNLLNQVLNELEKKYDDESFELAQGKLESLYTNTFEKVIKQYDEQTNIDYFPVEIKKEFRNRIESQFKWIKSLNINQLKDNAMRIRNKHKFDQMNQNIINRINNLLKESYSVENFENLVSREFEQFDRINEQRIEEQKIQLADLIKQTQIFYADNLKTLSGETRELIKFNQITDLDQFYQHRDLNQWQFNKNLLTRLKESKLVQMIFGQKKNSNADEKINQIFYIYNNKILAKFPTIRSPELTRSLIKELIYLVYRSINDVNNEFHIVEVFNDIMKLALCEMINQIYKLQEAISEREKNEYGSFKTKLIKQSIDTFNLKNKDKEFGIYSGEMFFKEFYNSYETKEILDAKRIVIEIIQNWFKSPTDLIEYAFKTSFEIGNFANVYKYVTDINRYCLEVCIQAIKSEVDLKVINKKNTFIKKFKGIMEFLRNFTSSESNENERDLCSSYDVFEKLRQYSNKHKEYRDLNDIFTSVIKKQANTQVDKSLFMIGFGQALSSQIDKISESIENLKNGFLDKTHKNAKNYIEQFLGCNETCPGCGSKCDNPRGHDGNHCSNKHIFDGFNGWRVKGTKKITTYFCWSELKFLKLTIYTNNCTIEYETFKMYLEKMHPNWLYDVEEKYLLWGKNDSSSEMLKFKQDVIRAWMNTRLPLIGDRVDIVYEKDWLALEKKDKMLPANHKPIWKDHF